MYGNHHVRIPALILAAGILAAPLSSGCDNGGSGGTTPVKEAEATKAKREEMQRKMEDAMKGSGGMGKPQAKGGVPSTTPQP